jgi:LmbE family N-acetylglucosaminyl deacetylase
MLSFVRSLGGFSYAQRMSGQPEIIVFSPHFDDAVLGPWTELRDARGSARVITFFTGEPKPGFVTRFDTIAGATESASLMRERASEDRNVLEAMSATTDRLGFLDNQYRPGSDGITRAGANAPTRREMLDAIGNLDPEATVFAPVGLGGHADHVVVRNFALDLASNGLAAVLYADIPYASHYGWPSWVTGATPTPHLDAESDWHHYLKEVVADWTLTPRVRRLDEPERLLKLDAVRAYRTQYPSLTHGPVDTLAHPHTLGFEVYWTVSRGE